MWNSAEGNKKICEIKKKLFGVRSEKGKLRTSPVSWQNLLGLPIKN
jgi:hypothetical protein